MLKKIYYWFRDKTSRSEEKGEASGGIWQTEVRQAALDLCDIESGRILEVGCGEGLFLRKLTEKRPSLKLSGIDISLQKLLKARQRLNAVNAEIFQSDAAKIPFKTSVFDMVFCINTIFNMPEKKAVSQSIKEMGRVCKEGGKVIIDIRNSLNPLLFLKYRLAKYYDGTVVNLPLKTYNFKEITSFLDKSGLKVIRKKCLGFPYNIFSPIILIEAKKC
ncbi:MAG: class I SAM-dependent methyltransferase [Candidatus Omnitrophica bacterium]|nr:class I SAM-dependent methyltransferase [Candidatus Omnitrophota bacterium]MCM8770472.1 class I SAM-dependent methyltransferase [Candidatus Omnitrophota bacterium]